MADYKWINNEQTEVLKYSGGCMAENGYGWDEFQRYLDSGGQVDPWKTNEQILEDARSEKLQDLKTEKNSRVDAVVGTSDKRKKDKLLARTIKLLRRETKGIAKAKELAELDQMEALDDFLDYLDSEYDAAEAWLEDGSRILEQIQGYDVTTDPAWTVVS